MISGRDEKMLMKLVVDMESDKVLGCHILGGDAAEIVQMAADRAQARRDQGAVRRNHGAASERGGRVRHDAPQMGGAGTGGRVRCGGLRTRSRSSPAAGRGSAAPSPRPSRARARSWSWRTATPKRPRRPPRAIVKANGAASSHEVDVTDTAQVKSLMQAIGAAHGRLDVLVNNAGVGERSDFRHLSDEAWDRVWKINLDGTVRCAREAFDLLKASGNASVINLSSIMASKHTRQMAVYSATKGAVSALSRSLAVEYAPYGIRVNTLLPGYVETALIGRYLSNPMIAKALLTQTPLRRFGTPQDIANAALFLASDEAAYITGAALNVDGGMATTL